MFKWLWIPLTVSIFDPYLGGLALLFGLAGMGWTAAIMITFGEGDY